MCRRKPSIYTFPLYLRWYMRGGTLDPRRASFNTSMIRLVLGHSVDYVEALTLAELGVCDHL